MHNGIRAGFFMLALCLFPLVAQAAVKPSELAPIIKADAPYGAGTLYWLFIPAYDATLWMDSKSWSMSAPFALSLQYRMGFSNDMLVSRTMDEVRHVAPEIPQAKLDNWRAMLAPLFPDVKAGQTITALYEPGKPTRFYLDGKLLGEAKDPAFARPFFSIWLSPETSEKSLRRKLLGLKS
jgi:hypothetical protein